MKKALIKQILRDTETGYNLVADKFSQTRGHFWRGLEFVADYVRDGDNILDFGCGNGRLLEIIGEKKINYIGVDVSRNLIDIAKSEHPGYNFLKIASSGSLAFSTGYFNVVYSIAVFHHIPSRKLRREIAKELCRVMVPGGRIIITVWNLWQPKYIKNIFFNWIGKVAGKSKLDWNDCYITFKNNQGEIFKRYHRAFTRKELKKLFNSAGFEIEKCEALNGRNIILIAKKRIGKQ